MLCNRLAVFSYTPTRPTIEIIEINFATKKNKNSNIRGRQRNAVQRSGCFFLSYPVFAHPPPTSICTPPPTI